VSGNQELEALTFAEDLLRRGDYARGWPAWERARQRLARYVPHAIPRGLAGLLEWAGGPVPSDVLVLQEGGAGDTFMVARYAADLRAAGAIVRWQSPPELAALLRTVPGMSAVYDRPTPIGPYTSWVRALSLPARLGVPGIARVPYVRASRQAWNVFRHRLRPSIGVRTTSGPLTPGGADRDLPPAFRERLTTGLLARGYNVVDLDLPIGTSWQVTARLIRSCKAVVSVDTGVAHLAGALGADLRIILNARADWRWGTAGTTPWYPTARLFRRADGGSWLTALLEAIVDL
jgi:glycosyl transferase family 9 (putative heptosyltransferase)